MNEELILDCIEVLIKSEATVEMFKGIVSKIGDNGIIATLNALTKEQQEVLIKLREAL